MTLAFVCVQLDTVLEICLLISGQKVCHYLGGDKGGGGSRKTVTNGDKGGRGSKNLDFYGDILFEWPLSSLACLKFLKTMKAINVYIKLDRFSHVIGKFLI